MKFVSTVEISSAFILVCLYYYVFNSVKPCAASFFPRERNSLTTYAPLKKESPA